MDLGTVMTQTILRPAVLADMPRVHALMRELAIFEKAPNEVWTTEADFERDFTAVTPCFGCIVAENETAGIVGFALYYFAYSTWKGKMLYLEDLLVTEHVRGQGIGKRLFEETISIAKSNQCRMMKWQVLDWNTPAIDFYEAHGADIDKGWYNGRLFFGLESA